MTTADVYRRFETLEEEVAHCYFMLQERFIANNRLAKFWVEAALEELQHASILRFCREHGLLAKTPISTDAADRVDQLLDIVKATVSKRDLTVEKAFSAAFLIESSDLDETYEKLSRPLAQGHLLLYEAIQANLRLHHYNFAEGAAAFLKDKTLAEAFRTLASVERRVFEKGRSDAMHESA